MELSLKGRSFAGLPTPSARPSRISSRSRIPQPDARPGWVGRYLETIRRVLVASTCAYLCLMLHARGAALLCLSLSSTLASHVSGFAALVKSWPIWTSPLWGCLMRALNVATNYRLDEPDLRALVMHGLRSTWRALIVDKIYRVRRARTRDAAGFVHREHTPHKRRPL
jgi:hypothetical protein